MVFPPENSFRKTNWAVLPCYARAAQTVDIGFSLFAPLWWPTFRQLQKATNSIFIMQKTPGKVKVKPGIFLSKTAQFPGEKPVKI
jgi:hypothetical protein